MTKFSVEKQATTWLCWAASTQAIAKYFGLGAPTQEGIAKFYEDKTKGADPRKALKEQFNMTTANVFDWEDVPTASNVKDREADLRGNLKAYLPSGPMLCGLIEARNTKWAIAGRATPYTYRHATVIFRYDDASDAVSFADPARPDTRGREVAVPVKDMVSGFAYVSAGDLGPDARQILPPGLSDISVRMYLLAYFMKGR